MAEDVKDRILAAAYEEFSTKGKAGARMQAIADRADINKAMLNYYFTSKDQLYFEVVKNMLLKYGDRFKQKLAGISNAREYLYAYINLHNEMSEENPNWVRLLAHNILDGELMIGKIFEEMETSIRLKTRIKEFIESGQIKIKDPVQVFILIVSLTVGPKLFIPIFSQIFSEEKESLSKEKRIDAIFQLFDHGLFEVDKSQNKT